MRETIVKSNKTKSWFFEKIKKIEIVSGIFSDHKAMRLENNYKKKKKTVRNTNTWRLNNTFLNNKQVTEEIKREIIIANNNENITTQNPWDAVKAFLRGKFIAIQSYLKKQEKHRIDNVTLHLKQLEREEQKNPNISRRKEIIKI